MESLRPQRYFSPMEDGFDEDAGSQEQTDGFPFQHEFDEREDGNGGFHGLGNDADADADDDRGMEFAGMMLISSSSFPQ